MSGKHVPLTAETDCENADCRRPHQPCSDLRHAGRQVHVYPANCPFSSLTPLPVGDHCTDSHDNGHKQSFCCTMQEDISAQGSPVHCCPSPGGLHWSSARQGGAHQSIFSAVSLLHLPFPASMSGQIIPRTQEMWLQLFIGRCRGV